METTKQWKRLSDFQSVKTDDLTLIANKYLALPFYLKTKMVNKETGEETESRQTIFEAGAYMNPDRMQKLNFTLQTESREDLSDICVTNCYYPPMHELRTGLSVYEILFDLGYDFERREQIHKKIAAYASTPGEAIQISKEYLAIYTDYAKDTCKVLSVNKKPYHIDEATNDDIASDKDDGINYYKIDVKVTWTFKRGGDTEHPYHDRIEYISDAYEVKDAREHALEYTKKAYENQTLMEAKVVKAQQYNAALIVPKEYSEWYTGQKNQEI